MNAACFRQSIRNSGCDAAIATVIRTLPRFRSVSQPSLGFQRRAGLRKSGNGLDRLFDNRLTSRSCESRFLKIEVCQVRAQLKATSLLAISAFLVRWVVPPIDLPETSFDEANTPTNEMVVQEQSACLGRTSSLKAFVPRLFAHTRKTRVSNTPSVPPSELSSSYSQELVCTLRC